MKFQSQPTEEIVSYQARFDQQAGSYVPKMMTNAQNQAQCTVSRPQQSYSYAPELDIEYYQCTPKHPMMNQNPSPFQPVINSMRQFCTSQPSGESNQNSYQASNHQTFIYSHDSEDGQQKSAADEHVQVQQNKVYRSHTKIIPIPNGVKIITEILRDDNVGDCAKNDLNFDRSHPKDEWLGQKIEVDVQTEVIEEAVEEK